MYGQGSFNPQTGGQGSQTPIAPPYSHRPPPLPHSFQLGPPPHTGQLSLPPPQHLPAHGGTANAVQPYLHSSTTVRGIAPFQHVYAPAQHSSYLASGPPPPPPFDLHRLEMLQAPLPPRGLPPPPPPPPPSQGQRLYNSLPQQLAGVHGLQRIPPPPPPPLFPTSSFSTSAPCGSAAEFNGTNPQMLSTAPPPPPPPPSSTSSAPPIPPSPPQPNSHMLPVSAPVLAGSYPLFHSDIASNSSKPSGDKLGTTGSANVAIPLNQGRNSVHGNLYLEGGSGTEVGCELDEAKNFSQPSHLMVAAGAHMPTGSDSDMEMEVEWFPDWFYCVNVVPRGLSPSYFVKKWYFCVLDDASLECLLVVGRKNDITQSDNDQAAKHPIGDLIHCNHLIAGDSDVREQLHELQSSARSDAATMDLSVPGPSRLDNGQQGSKLNSFRNQLTSGKTVSEVHSPVINSAGADGKSSSRATEAAGCVNSDKYSSDVLKGGSPFRLLQDYASEDSSENNDESYLKNTIPKTASKLVTVGSEDLQQEQQPSYCFSHFASDNVHVLSGKIGSSSVFPQDILDSNQLSCLPNFAVSKNSTLPNNYPASFELPFNSKFSSDVLRQENVASYTRKDGHSSSWNHASLDGQDASVGSRQPIPSPNSARDVAQIIPRSGSDQYDPFFDSIEPTSNSFKRLDHIQKWESSNTDIMLRLSGSDKSLDVEENNKKEVRNIALSTFLDNEEFGETADAEVGDVEDQSQNNPVVVNVNMGDMEIDQVKSPGKSKNSKESRSMKLFKVALADFVKEVLKPSWRQGNMSKEAFKTIVKKTVDKVTGAMKNHQIPKSKAKIDHYIDSSQWKLTKLVMVNPPFFYFEAAKLSLNDAF
ncbi:hypothetical protein DKX38_027997 [Salix brachista]|uniref:Uncharacterized protein n=1 Tax=Salix brachista TaxID=2182728 RepID=A0A5N5J4J8_9ROSI|nr:hypothetical protein DKX38_027997 [Salix brachista]